MKIIDVYDSDKNGMWSTPSYQEDEYTTIVSLYKGYQDAIDER